PDPGDPAAPSPAAPAATAPPAPPPPDPPAPAPPGAQGVRPSSQPHDTIIKQDRTHSRPVRTPASVPEITISESDGRRGAAVDRVKIPRSPLLSGRTDDGGDPRGYRIS